MFYLASQQRSERGSRQPMVNKAVKFRHLATTTRKCKNAPLKLERVLPHGIASAPFKKVLVCQQTFSRLVVSATTSLSTWFLKNV